MRTAAFTMNFKMKKRILAWGAALLCCISCIDANTTLGGSFVPAAETYTFSRAPGRSTIAAGALNGRVRDGNGCGGPAMATGHGKGSTAGSRGKDMDRRRGRGRPAARVRAPGASRRSFFSTRPPGPRKARRRGAARPSRTAYQNRSAETLAGLAHPACRPGRLPGAFSVLAHGDG